MQNVPQWAVNESHTFTVTIAFPDTGANLTLKFDHGKLANGNDFGRLPEDNKFGRRIVQLALRFTF